MKGIKYYFFKLLKKFRGSGILNSNIHSTSKIESGSNIVSVNMDRYSFCGYDCEIVNTDIGPFCSIANNVVIGGAMHPLIWVSSSPVFYAGRDSVKKKFSEFRPPETKKTIIGADVWIGGGAYVKQGVTIGTGAVVGMGSVVTKDVAPYSIVAGNPAKEIKRRFDDDTINNLLVSRWWEWDDNLIAKKAKHIQDVKLFLERETM